MNKIAKRKIQEPNPPAMPTPTASMLSLANEGIVEIFFSKKVLIRIIIGTDLSDPSKGTLFVC